MTTGSIVESLVFGMLPIMLSVSACNGTSRGSMKKAKRCQYCAQALPRELRADAMYCPGSRCRVYAHRRRKRLGQKPSKKESIVLQEYQFSPRENPTKQLLAALQRKRKHAKLPLLIQDAYLQAEADKLACDTMTERVRKLEHEARERAYKHWGGFYLSQEEQTLSSLAKIKVSPEATHIGMHVIPNELGGGVVLCTAKRIRI